MARTARPQASSRRHAKVLERSRTRCRPDEQLTEEKGVTNSVVEGEAERSQRKAQATGQERRGSCPGRRETSGPAATTTSHPIAR